MWKINKKCNIYRGHGLLRCKYFDFIFNSILNFLFFIEIGAFKTSFKNSKNPNARPTKSIIASNMVLNISQKVGALLENIKDSDL